MSKDSDENDGGVGALKDLGHTALDLLGMVPVLGEPADLANAAWHAAEGNYLDAGLSLISVIPVIGDVVGKGGKLASRLGVKLPGKALDLLKTLNFAELLGKFKKHPKLGPDVEKITHALEGWREGLLKKFSDCAAPGAPAGCPLLVARQKQAAELIEQAAKSEKKVTSELFNLAEKSSMKMEGLDHKLKTVDSLSEKLIKTHPDDVHDALRYTMVSPPVDLAQNARKTLEALQAQGYEVLKVKNTFLVGAPYKGLNTQLKTPGGQFFELQFHTPDSFFTKDKLTHDLYKQIGKLSDADPLTATLLQQVREISSRVPTPPGLTDALKGFLK